MHALCQASQAGGVLGVERDVQPPPHIDPYYTVSHVPCSNSILAPCWPFALRGGVAAFAVRHAPP